MQVCELSIFRAAFMQIFSKTCFRAMKHPAWLENKPKNRIIFKAFTIFM